MTAEKYTFPVTDGGFDAVFREYRAILRRSSERYVIHSVITVQNTRLFMMRHHTALRQAENA